MEDVKNLKKFNEKNYTIKHFSRLQSTFWDSSETIKQNYEKLKKIIEENNIQPEQDGVDFQITSESLKESYDFLMNQEQRQNYLSFLKYYYFLSEPITLNQLKKNYFNKLFPFYLFTIKIKQKQQISTLIIDFIEKKLTITYKDKEYNSILSDDIITVNKKFGTTIIIMVKKVNEKNNKSQTLEVTFEPEILQQIDLIYTLICYLAKSIQDNNFYELLEDDNYRPCGIILRTRIVKDHRVKMYGKDDRYAVLGPSMIIIFKNEEMKDIRNILPLFPFFMRISFVEKERKIIFKYPTREQGLSFFDNEHYSVWVSTLKEIFNKRIKTRMDTVESFQASENKEKEKIIKEIGVEILCTQEEINTLKNKLETIKNKFTNNNNEKK